MAANPTGPPTREEFVVVLIERLQQAGETGELRYDEANFQLIYLEDVRVVERLRLVRMFDELHRTPIAERKDWWKNTAAKLQHHLEDFAGMDDKRLTELRPSIRPRSYFDNLDIQGETDGLVGSPIPFAPIGEHLVACVVHDLPESMAYMHAEHLAHWGISFRDAMRAARRNLENIDVTAGSISNKVFAFEVDDSYNVSRICCKSFLKQFPIDGDVIAVAPNRNAVYITGSNNEIGLSMLEQMAGDYLTEPDPMCPIPIRLVDNKWQTWMPPAGHPQHDAFRRLQRKFLFSEYRTQKASLEKYYEAKETDVFVATYFYTGAKDGTWEMTHAMWAKDLCTLLPRVEYVLFVDQDRKMELYAPWKNVIKTLGHMMQLDPDRYPPRWYVEEFPSDEQLRQAGAKKQPF